MRAKVFGAVTVAIVILTGVAFGQDGEKKVDAARIAELIRQLGHDEFLKREAAGEELEAIGDAALPALRKALEATDDPEIRLRTREIIPSITDRAANEDLKKFQGTWSLVSGQADGKQISAEDRTVTFTITGNQWATRNNGMITDQGTCRFVDQTGQVRRVDLVPVGGGNTTFAICQIEGDTLKYCRHTNPDARPTDFTTALGDGRNSTVWKRVKP